MNQSIEIIKDLIIPFLQQKERESLDINWKNILNGFVAYDNNDQLLRNEIDKLKLINENKIISVLPDLYDSFLDDLAEQFVIGNSSESSNKLFKDKNSLFIDKVNFYISLKGAITKMERKKIIDELKANEIFSENNLELGFKNKGREELKAKFKEWDKELDDKKRVIKLDPSKSDINIAAMTKVRSFSWSKLAIAASIALLIGFSLYKTFSSSNTHSFKTNILFQTEMGFAGNKTPKEIEVIFKYSPSFFTSNTKNEYTFFKNILTMYSKYPDGKIHLLELDKNQFYIFLENDFYQIKETSIPLSLVKEDNTHIIEQLEKIIFENE